jgi:hypothetical protein
MDRKSNLFGVLGNRRYIAEVERFLPNRYITKYGVGIKKGHF